MTGLLVGVIATVIGGALVDGLLYSVPGRHPLTLALAATVPMAVAAPAIRATQVDPAVALCDE